MKCGHSFNYGPLVKDIISVKNNNHMERFRLKANQIRCPYCRNIENHVLPYIRQQKCGKKDGVNWLDISKHKVREFICYSEGPCFSCNNNNRKTILSPCGQFHFCLDHYKENYPRNRVFSAKKEYNFNINKNNDENFIVQTETHGCCSILKSGLRKGQMCGAAKKLGDFCLRHAPKQ